MTKMKHAMHSPSSSSTWLECSLHYHYKLEAIKAGEVWDTSGEAAKRGTLQHNVLEHAFPHFLRERNLAAALTYGLKKSKAKLRTVEKENVRIALEAGADLVPEGMFVEVELAVPLSHEPGSTGHVDVVGFCDDHILILDWKMGQMAVSPNSPQLRIYAANVVDVMRKDEECITPLPTDRVKVAIVQPQLHREALVRVFSVEELDRFRHYVDGVVDLQVNGHDRRGAGSLNACTWCPAKGSCFHRANLVGSMLVDLKSPVGMADHVTEEVVRSRSAFKKVIDECVAKVVAHPKRFPNWTRVDVSNARKWSGLLDPSEIESQLIDAGAESVHNLKTPAQVQDSNPDLGKLIDKLSAEQGHHVRLYPGAPKAGTPKKEPAKRASAKRAKAAPNKKSARKKAAKKKARKKNARRI